MDATRAASSHELSHTHHTRYTMSDTGINHLAERVPSSRLHSIELSLVQKRWAETWFSGMLGTLGYTNLPATLRQTEERQRSDR
jgi:hypothetical protein